MADLPIETKAVFSAGERLEVVERDIQELARGINIQGRLLESVVLAFDHVVKKYLELTGVKNEKKEEQKETSSIISIE